MTLTDLEHIRNLIFLVGAACFGLGLHLMNSPASARSGNRLSATGMTMAVAAELAIRMPRSLRSVARSDSELPKDVTLS